MGSTCTPVAKLSLVKELSEKYNVTVNDILISYQIRKGIVVIPRSLNPVRIVNCIEFAPLTKEEIKMLDYVGKKEPIRYID